ncbi:FAD-dependent oxidoreductase [Pseudonocardia sp. H11422]|uniref:FAD-dependent oxidoreductase n=1 Tax=Pseudonocardia sp. H11422 TaxID=2835866 RepID=UPI001BDD32C7|nr:FAD-dependent oxidoreductase [Pseudonocardia sp. H11422]
MRRTVRGGAHNAWGSAVTDDALMIDLSRLDTVQVDPPASCGPWYERPAAAIKAVYDPDDVFRGNANIRPAAAPR